MVREPKKWDTPWPVPVAILLLLALGLAATLSDKPLPPATWSLKDAFFDNLGGLIPLALLMLAVVVLMFIGQRKGLPLDFLLDDKNIAYNAIGFTFFPGYRLLTPEMQSASRGPTGHRAATSALSVLVFVVIGASFVAAPDIIGTYWFALPDDWRASGNWSFWLAGWLAGVLGYIALCFLTNLLTAKTLREGYQIDIARRLKVLLTFFGLSDEDYDSRTREPHATFWSTFYSQMDNIYGHRIWATKKTHDFVESLSDKRKQLGTSLWFLLDFAAEVLDHQIDENGISCEFKRAQDYSNFLARTMHHSSKSIVWFVDPEDLRLKIFPAIHREVLLSLAECLAKRSPDKPTELAMAALSEFSDLVQDAAAGSLDTPRPGTDYCKRICQKFSTSCNGVDNIKCPPGLDERVDFVLTRSEAFATDYVAKNWQAKDPIEAEKVWSSIEERGSNVLGLPHISKYQQQRVPKARVFLLEPQMGVPNGSEYDGAKNNIGADNLKNILLRLAKVYGVDLDSVRTLPERDVVTKIVAKMELLNGLSDEQRRFVFWMSWKMLLNTCGREDHRIAGFGEISEDDQKKYIAEYCCGEDFKDLGLYDGEVLVSSARIPNERAGEAGEGGGLRNRPRMVKWTVLPPDSGDSRGVRNVFLRYDPREVPAGMDFAAYVESLDTDVKRVYPLNTFVEGIEEFCSGVNGSSGANNDA